MASEKQVSRVADVDTAGEEELPAPSYSPGRPEDAEAPPAARVLNIEFFTRVLADELDPATPASTADRPPTPPSAPMPAAPGQSGAERESTASEEAPAVPNGGPGDGPGGELWWGDHVSRAVQEWAAQTVGAVQAAHRALSAPPQGEEHAGAPRSDSAQQHAGGADSAAPSDKDEGRAEEGSNDANGSGGVPLPTDTQPHGGASGGDDPLSGIRTWAADTGAGISVAAEEQAGSAKTLWDDFVHTAHMAFATEFLPVGLWPTAPKGARGARGGGDGCGRDDYSLALTVSSADVFVTASQEPVRCVAVVSGSGGRVVSGSIDTTLRVWSLADGSKLHKLKGHSAPIRALVAIPSSVSGEGPEGGPTGLSLVASASDDGSIRVWDVEAGALQYALLGHSGPVSAICVLPGHRLVSGSWDRLVVVWSLTSGSAERVMEGHRGPVQAVCGASRGRVVSASLDKRIRLWLVATGACERVFDIGRQLGATALATLDATRFVECTGDGWIRVWNLDTGACLRTKKGHQAGIYSAVVFGADTRPKLLTASTDKSAGVWDAEELDLERLLMAGGMDSVWAAIFSPAS